MIRGTVRETLLLFLMVVISRGASLPGPASPPAYSNQGYNDRFHPRPILYEPAASRSKVLSSREDQSEDYDRYQNSYGSPYTAAVGNTVDRTANDVPLIWVSKDDIKKFIPWAKRTLGDRDTDRYRTGPDFILGEPEEKQQVRCEKNARKLKMQLEKLLQELQDEILRFRLEKDELRKMCKKSVPGRSATQRSASDDAPRKRKMKKDAEDAGQNEEDRTVRINMEVNANHMNRHPEKFGRHKGHHAKGHRHVRKLAHKNRGESATRDHPKYAEDSSYRDYRMADNDQPGNKDRSNSDHPVKRNLTGGKSNDPHSSSDEILKEKNHSFGEVHDQNTKLDYVFGDRSFIAHPDNDVKHHAGTFNGISDEGDRTRKENSDKMRNVDSNKYTSVTGMDSPEDIADDYPRDVNVEGKFVTLKVGKSASTDTDSSHKNSRDESESMKSGDKHWTMNVGPSNPVGYERIRKHESPELTTGLNEPQRVDGNSNAMNGNNIDPVTHDITKSVEPRSQEYPETDYESSKQLDDHVGG